MVLIVHMYYVICMMIISIFANIIEDCDSRPFAVEYLALTAHEKIIFTLFVILATIKRL